ncbi:MAG: HD domain-containing protein [Clostridia bacterium]|nr:HD domain-containing protein [Clostridia bacterium]
MTERLRRRLEFFLETDRMKYVIRRTPVGNVSRKENDAEHSFSLALLAMVLEEYADDNVSIDRVIRMALVHDLIEIYAGDTYVYDQAAMETKAAREDAAAEKLFGMLPREQGKEYEALWREFDAEETPDARFAACLDHFQPLLMNYYTDGVSWLEHNVCRSQVVHRMQIIREVFPMLYELVEAMLSDAVRRGWLRDE